SGIDMSDLDQIVELRVPLEILAGRLAAVRIRPEEAAELGSLVDGWDVGKLCAERDFVELLRLDQDFHRAIARIARNRFLEGTLEQLRDLTWRFYMVFYRRRAPAETDSFNNYRVIVTALAERDPERVEAALREHFRDSLAMFD